MNANINAAQTEFNADLSGVKGELTTIDQKLDKLPGSWKIFSVITGAVATGLVILLTVLALMGDRFDSGMAATSVHSQQVQDATKTSQDALTKADKIAQDMIDFNKQWDVRGEKLDKLLPKLEALVEPAKNETPQKGQDLLQQ